MQKKADAIFVKEAKIKTAAPVIKTFESCLHGLQILMGERIIYLAVF